jgi:hypothetical protein
MSRLEEMRSRIQATQDKNKSFGKKSTENNANYNFWEIPDGDFASIRFLPNGVGEGDFWVDKLMIKLPFAGVRGKNTNPTIVTVPCMQMYGEKCPIQEEIKPLWKTGDEETARLYYRKKTHVLHGFVRKNAVPEDVTPENPVRRFNVHAKLMTNIIAGVMDPEIKYDPTDYEHGTDFHLYKTKQGKWADYSTSRWSRNSSSLTEEEAQALDAFPLPDLTSYLPKKPDEQTLAIIMEMFVDSMNGEAYDVEKYGKFYKPFGLNDEGEAKSATAGSGMHTTVSKKSAPAAEETDVEETPVERPAVKTAATATSAGGQKQSVQDLLKQMKDKKKS